MIIFDELYFEKNEYFEKYLWLINSPQPAQILHKHHIIPRTYFTLLKMEVDNSENNIVLLSPANHALAHYYLALCTKGELKYRLRSCFIRMTGNQKFCAELNLEELEKLNEIKLDFGKQRSAQLKGKKLNEEQKQRRSKNAKECWSNPDYKEKMRKVMQERWDNISEERRAEIGHKISMSKKGIATIPAEKRPEVAVKILETKRKNGTLNLATETKQKISNTLKGHSVSEETRKKISESCKGKIPPNAKPVICIETGEEFPSARVASEHFNLAGGAVWKACKLGCLAGDFHWKFKENN